MLATSLSIERVPLSGVTLIEASAGTGKTYTLAALFVRLLLEAELSIDQILVVTYTRAATAELRVRIRKRLGQTLDALDGAQVSDDPILAALVEQARTTGQSARKRALLATALGAFDEAAIFTIHGFCQRVLRRYAFESGVSFEAELGEDQTLLVEEVTCDFWADRMARADASFLAALSEHKIDLTSLQRLLRRALPNPELHVVPKPKPVELSALDHDYRAELERTAQLWAKHRAQLVGLLLESGLNARFYGTKQVHETFVPVLDRLQDLAYRGLPEWFGRLTPATLLERCNKGRRPPEHPFFDACAALLQVAEARSAALDQQVQAFLHDFLDYARSELPRRSEQRGLMGFEDLLRSLSVALRGERGAQLAQLVRDSYRAALIDEFQDTDPVQLDVFRRIYASRQGAKAERPALFLIGDPKQAIYAFRGADIFAYLAASQHAVDRAHTLAVNYRSDPKLLRGVERIFTCAALPFGFAEIEFRPVQPRPGATDALQGAGVEFLFLERADEQQTRTTNKSDINAELPARIAAEIARTLNAGELLSGRPVQPGDIAVLCRTNLQASSIQAALRERGIPAVLDGDSSVFDAAMAEELGRWLWAMVEPADSARIRAALATAGLGLTAAELLALEEDEALWDAWVARFHRMQALWQTKGFLCALHALCEECQVTQRLLGLADGERRFTDLWHLAELLHEEEQATRKGPRALLDFYRRVRAGSAAREGVALEDVQLRLESDAHAVTLTTVHKSKGLEYPLVYCPFLWSSAALSNDDRRLPMFHDAEAEQKATLLLPGAQERDRALSAAQREALAESLRLLYVALTRAKHRVSVVWGGLSGVQQSALAYLLHQPRDVAPEFDALYAATVKRVAAMSDAELLSDLTQLCAADPEAMSVRMLCRADDTARYTPPALPSVELAPRSAQWPVYTPSRVGSFSSLIESHKHGRAPARPELAELLDRDALVDGGALGDEIAPQAARVQLADFPAGASFGHLVHALYEHADFQAGEAELAAVVARVLADYAADPSWAAQLTAALADTLSTPLSPAGGALPCLASVARDQRLSELEFTFPVIDGELAGGDARAALRAGQLAELLARHAPDDRAREYARELAKLRFAPLRGFLRGFIDLVVQHEGMYYVIDYKSNRLGEDPRDYRRAQLEPVMYRHHYTLQYLLYSVALYRYLALRLPGFDYDRHFGGVYYLFVRGMSVQHEPGTGVFFERPSRALIEELSRFLRAPEAAC